MTEQQLEDIEARAKAATAGPWEWYESDEIVECGGGSVCTVFTADDYTDSMDYGDAAAFDANGPFIAASRTDVPALCGELRQAWQWLSLVAQDSDQYRLGESAGTNSERRRVLDCLESMLMTAGNPDSKTPLAEPAARRILPWLMKQIESQGVGELLPHDETRRRCERMEAALRGIYALADGLAPHDAAQSAYRLGLAIGTASKALEG